MTFYSNLRDKTALPLLKKYGQQVTVTRRIYGDVNPGTGARAVTSTTTFTAYCAVFNYDKSYVDNTNVLASDKRAIIDGKAMPLINDTVTTDDGDFTVLNVNKTGPSGEAVIYELHLRY